MSWHENTKYQTDGDGREAEAEVAEEQKQKYVYCSMNQTLIAVFRNLFSVKNFGFDESEFKLGSFKN